MNSSQYQLQQARQRSQRNNEGFVASSKLEVTDPKAWLRCHDYDVKAPEDIFFGNSTFRILFAGDLPPRVFEQDESGLWQQMQEQNPSIENNPNLGAETLTFRNITGEFYVVLYQFLNPGGGWFFKCVLTENVGVEA
jgi:hypothetical protein